MYITVSVRLILPKVVVDKFTWPRRKNVVRKENDLQIVGKVWVNGVTEPRRENYNVRHEFNLKVILKALRCK